MVKLIRYLHICLFLTFIALPGGLLLIPQANGGLMKDENLSLEERFSKSFAFRGFFLKLHSLTSYYLFSDSPRDNVILGSNGWFFRGRGKQRLNTGKISEYDYLKDVERSYTEEQVEKWVEVLQERSDFLKERGIPYIFFIAPKKSLIYPEHLPTKLRERQEKNPKNFAEALTEKLENDSSVTAVNTFQALRSAKKKNPSEPLYLKTDGHWNSLGALVAHQQVMKRANKLLPDKEIKILTREDFDLKWKENWSHKGFSNQIGFSITEPFPKLTPKEGNPIQTALDLRKTKNSKKVDGFWISPYLKPNARGEHLVTLTNSEGAVKQYSAQVNPNGKPFKTILLLGDSFLMKLYSFFAAHSEVTLRLRSEKDFPKHYFSSDHPKPDLVVQEVSQRYLGIHAPKR